MYFYERGYPKEAVAEYLLNLANSDFYDWRKANPTVPYTEFPLKLENMGVSSALFDLVKLNDISKDVIATYTAEQAFEYGLTWARQYDPALAAVLEADRAYSVRVFNVERTGDAPRKDLINWSDIERAVGFFFDPLYEAAIARDGYPFPASVPLDDRRAILEEVARFDFQQSKDDWLAAMRALAERLGYARDVKTFKKAEPGTFKGHFGDVMMVVRVALTGKTNTPDLYEIIQTLGPERLQRRIAQAETHR
jgi:glutamyl-tRNA synthetase